MRVTRTFTGYSTIFLIFCPFSDLQQKFEVLIQLIILNHEDNAGGHRMNNEHTYKVLKIYWTSVFRSNNHIFFLISCVVHCTTSFYFFCLVTTHDDKKKTFEFVISRPVFSFLRDSFQATCLAYILKFLL